jgi:hypothetical protein
MDAEARAEFAAFLTGAPLVGGGPAGVYRTDGMWVWPESMATTVLASGLLSDRVFDYHIRVRGFFYPEQVEPSVLERARQMLVVAAGADGSEQIREPNVPGCPPEPTEKERMAALSAWHSEWVSKHEATTAFRPQDNAGVEDYNLHYVDLDASKEAQREYDVRAREILGQDPETGSPVDI